MIKTDNTKSVKTLGDTTFTVSFPLLRYFTLISLASIILASILLGTWVRNIAVDNLILNEERNNVALTRVLSNVVWPRYQHFITKAHQYSLKELKAHPKTQELNTFLNNQIKGLDIVKIKIYDLNGLTVFSSDFKQIGASKKMHKSFISAVKGNVVTKLSFRDKIYAKTEFISDRNIIASYVPIKPNGSQQVEGVFEVYKDVTPILKKTHDTQTKVLIAIIGTLTVLFLILFFVVRHADKIINKHNSKQQAEKEAIRNIAIYDTLTGLPNRILFNERLEHALYVSGRSEKLLALMFIDLDRFKQVNDNLGHEAGDRLLCQVAERLSICVRSCDTVARISGDEFTVILENLDSIDIAITTSKRIIDEISKPYILNNQEIYITCSAGISFYPFEDDDPESLIRKADSAMYFSKSAGRNNYSFYSPEMKNSGSKHYQLEKDLHLAIEQEQFSVYFQPKVNINTYKMESMEALMRWEHPELGIVMPSDFIPILEDTGKIIQAGDWVLRESCRLTKKYIDEGFPPLRVAVNISALQIKQPSFYDDVISILKDTGLDAQYLELELTESCLIEDLDKSIALLQKIKDYGITLTIDDFGTGYSSLNYLSQLPIDTLKIDRSFVQDIMQSKQKRSIITTIINFAHGLNMKIVAEGVEDSEQLIFLSAMRCTTVQGFLLSRPIPEAEFHSLLESNYDFRIAMGISD